VDIVGPKSSVASRASARRLERSAQKTEALSTPRKNAELAMDALRAKQAARRSAHEAELTAKAEAAQKTQTVSTPRRHDLAMEALTAEQALRISSHETELTAKAEAARSADSARVEARRQWLENEETRRQDEIKRQTAHMAALLEAQSKMDKERQAAEKRVRAAAWLEARPRSSQGDGDDQRRALLRVALAL
jgi:hypothetical protein